MPLSIFVQQFVGDNEKQLHIKVNYAKKLQPSEKRYIERANLITIDVLVKREIRISMLFEDRLSELVNINSQREA